MSAGSFNYSLYSAVYEDGSWWDVGLDALGLVVDTAALALPFVPGGVGVAIKSWRTMSRGQNIITGLRTADNVVNLYQAGAGAFRAYDNIQDGDYGSAALNSIGIGLQGLNVASRVMGNISRARRSTRIWDMECWEGGLAFEGIRTRHLGNKLPDGYKTFDDFDRAAGVATSVKTMDLSRASYSGSKVSGITSQGRKYIRQIAAFTEWDHGGELIEVGDITRRVFDLNVSGGATRRQIEKLLGLMDYASGMGVEMRLGVI